MIFYIADNRVGSEGHGTGVPRRWPVDGERYGNNKDPAKVRSYYSGCCTRT